jgi:hypothetical protein
MRPADLVGLIPGMGRSAIYEAIRRGDLPSVRVGARVFVPTHALRQLFLVPDDICDATLTPLPAHGAQDTTEAGVRTPATATNHTVPTACKDVPDHGTRRAV